MVALSDEERWGWMGGGKHQAPIARAFGTLS